MEQAEKIPVDIAILNTIGEYIRAGWTDTIVMLREMVRQVMSAFRLTLRQTVTQIRKFLGQ